MATAAQLRLPQATQAVIDLDPVWLRNAPYDLTGATLVAYVKTAANVPDSDPSTAVITEIPGPNGLITVTDAPGGVATITIAAAVIPDPAVLF